MLLQSCDITEHLNMSLNCNQSGILQQRTENVELKKSCVKLLEEFGSLRYTRQTLEELDAELRTELAKHGGNPLLDDILDELLEWRKWADENKLVQ
jgi:geranylgeranyl diphosphate synthase type 3